MMSSNRGYSNSRGSHSFSISRNGGSRNIGRNPNSGGRNPNSGGRNPKQMISMLLVCGCNLPMRMYIANTFENQGRRFWRYTRWNDEDQHTCALFIWDDELVPGMTHMMDDNAAMEASRVEGRNDEGCRKCTNIDEIMKRFDGRECVQWKKFEDERKKVKWLVLKLILSWLVFVLYVKN
ncbi:transmembrane protein, putative [Medicago truncatula]|uniref:Transmembrane protein, putative n=1 Tax=Medicago truncatula TaxID=3880 RepID=A0A072TDN4_MEDTR|nr:transmembrane protein, putative [Medicago truncatula]